MYDLIAQLRSGAELTPDDISSAVDSLVSTEVSEEWKKDFLKALRSKGETAGEVAAFVTALLERAVDPGINPAELSGPMIDVCGTGGDKMELFNISTTSMFVLAAGGAAVVKHGNRAITSLCGGADVLEELGVRIDLSPADLRECVARVGLGFVFAPAYHPAFKVIAPVRKALAGEGIPTIFNVLGPLLNPARPPYQFVGIYSPAHLPIYANALQQLGRTRAWAVHGEGLDELSISGPSDIYDICPEAIRQFRVDSTSLGIPRNEVAELKGGDRKHNAGLLVGVLDGSLHGAKRDVVLLNAAAGFVVSGIAGDLAEGLQLAKEQIESGRALGRLRALQEFSGGLA